MARGTIITRNWRATLGFPPAAPVTRRRVLSAFKHLRKDHPARLQKLVLAKEAGLREIREKKLGG
jgi:hypothetical protein